MKLTKQLSAAHLAALEWFSDRAGQEVSWPGPLNGLFLVNRAKGIHKPANIDYALSVRQSMNGPYEDALNWTAEGRWTLEYAYEGTNPAFFTNRALRLCLRDGVPVGVLVQTKEKPNPRYRVLGLGQIVNESSGQFLIEQFGMGAKQAEAALDLVLPPTKFDAENAADARVRTMRAIAARRGQPAFRKMLLAAYRGQCAVSGCRLGVVLEAAHIIPYRGSHTNHVANGLLLRADIHTLFDLRLLWIDPISYLITVAPELEDTEYGNYSGKRLHLPLDESCWPDSGALVVRNKEQVPARDEVQSDLERVLP